MTEIKIVNIDKPFTDQKPGTSGLRKSTIQFEKSHYLEIFIESICQSLSDISGSTIILGGDGRYGNNQAIKKIIQLFAAHHVGKVIVARDGLLSTPAASNLIRKENALAGIILSASHNPGGIDGDFGVKLNVSNGGPAPEYLTNKIYKFSRTLTSYKIFEESIPDINNLSSFQVNDMDVEVIDGVNDYILLLEKLFDFDRIAEFVKNDYSIIFDAMSAVTGPYAKKIFVEKFGLSEDCVMNGTPLQDFGKLHPDPNLTYAKTLADLLLNKKTYNFGAACDGDGDRNMILGKGCFINPSDSLAIITANTHLVPGYKDGISGVARSMPTSTAVDSVAKELKIPYYETPTGWKFFGNLLDANIISICGEESFGTGSNHVREKDGLWAVLYWLQILTSKNCSVSECINEHWNKYGRNYYSRHDYEAIPIEVANQIFEKFSTVLPKLNGTKFANKIVKKSDNFSYIDPIDNSISENQGLRIVLEDESRIILRLSGTGTKGATLRLYFENIQSASGNLHLNPQIALKDLIVAVDDLLDIRNLTNMTCPTVIT